MNFHTLQKFIDEYDELLPSKVQQDIANVTSDITQTLQVRQQFVQQHRQQQEAKSTLHELEIYRIRYFELFQKIGKIQSHLELLLPSHNFNFIEEISLEIQEFGEATLDNDSSFTQFNAIMVKVQNSINQLEAKVNAVRVFVSPYMEEREIDSTDKSNALVSILFNDGDTVHSLKEFQKSLGKWNQILPQYNTLVTGESGKPVELVAVQEGCIDVVVNIDVDVALNLTKVFGAAIAGFFSYLTMKKKLEVSSNVKELDTEEDEEEEIAKRNLLEVSSQSIYRKTERIVRTQIHESQVGENNEKLIKTVTEVVTTHVVKGNEYTILNLPDRVEDDEDSEVEDELDKYEEVNKSYLELRDSISEDSEQKLIAFHDSKIKELREVITTVRQPTQPKKKVAKIPAKKPPEK